MDINKIIEESKPKKGNLEYIPKVPYLDATKTNLESLLFRLNRRIERTGENFIPEFQRERVWTLKQKQDLIISILNSLPIGAFFINTRYFDDKEKSRQLDGVLYDGQQRVNAILEFFQNEFPVDLNGVKIYCKDLNEHNWRNILRHGVLIYETNIDNLDELIDFYILINSNGTPHTPEDIEKAKSYKNKNNFN